MSAPSLYRRHRPRTFEDVVGQDHVVRTLRNAVEQGKVHHAYLFVGSRGTGKTSMAKILASCLDCIHGPTVTPCGVCDTCIAIQRATSLDVVEMDAASNNSVDDVRELRERVQTAPSGGRWRVYILDEAHMLTTQAWNALLKTLEEPPPQTVFVLATTEAHKVPATVVDRTHRFDFTRPTGEQISRVLARVAEQESITLTPGALGLVARHANGSFRDALGTLEQLVTYAGDSVTEQDAVTVLGIGDDAQVFGAVDAIIARDPRAVLRVVQDVASHGRDLGSYARELERHARDLLVCCILGGVPAEVRLTADRDAALDAQARRIGRDQATHLLELLATALTAARDGADGRAMLELALVKAADPSLDPALRALQSRLARLEDQLSGAPAPAQAPAPVAQASAPQPPAPPAPVHDPVPAVAAPPAQPAAPAAVPPPVAAGREEDPRAASREYPPADHHDYESAPPYDDEPAAPPIRPGSQHLHRVDDGPGALRAVPEPGAGGRPFGGQAHDSGEAPSSAPLAAVPHPAAEDAPPVAPPVPAAPAAPVPAAPPAPAAASGEPSLDEITAMWAAVIENLRGRDQLCAVALERARPVGIDGAELTIAFPTDAAFYRGTADREERRLALREALREVTGTALSARFELRDLTGPPPAAGEMPPPAPSAVPPAGNGQPAPGAAAAPPAARPSSSATLDEKAVVAHLVTEFDAEDIGDPDQEPS